MNKRKTKKTLLAISSAPNADSNSTTLLEEFCKGAEKAGARVIRLHLYDLNLPYFDYKNRKADPPVHQDNKDVKMIEGLMMDADGLVISAPVWNFSVPAILKNFFDRISYFGRVFKQHHGEYSMKKMPNLGHLDCYYIFTTGVPWYGWVFDQLAYAHSKLTMWYFGVKNRGFFWEANCGNGSKNVVKERPDALKKARQKGEWFTKKYLS